MKIRLPARAGLDSKKVEGCEIDTQLSNKILAECDLEGKLVKLSGDAKGFEGHYYFENSDENLFLKIVPKSHLSSQLEADRFAVFVKMFGVKSSSILGGYPKFLNESFVVLAYKWLDGRCLASDRCELEFLGAELGKLHKALDHFEDKKSIILNTQKRLKLLSDIASDIVNLKSIKSPILSRAQELLQSKLDRFEVFNEKCQVLHGDLNVGNLRKTTDGIVFLDFEDASHSWFPPCVDIAFAVERLAMINEEDDGKALDNSKALLSGYISVSGKTPFLERGALKKTLEWLSLRSLCILYHFECQGNSWPDSEWEKFDFLLDHLTRREKLLEEIEEAFFDESTKKN
jgi:thiamine kinase-like enzyme